MKKIGILTFHFACNYGAVLQTLGSVLILRELGFEPEVIDYHAFGKKKIWYGLGLGSLRKHGVLGALVQWRERRKVEKAFNEFVRANVPLSRPIDGLDGLRCQSKEYEAILSGSDQVWNSKITCGSDAYYLGFSEVRKIAWSASIGDMESSLNSENLKQIAKFDAISVRDKGTLAALSGINPADVTITADPTLMASFESFSQKPDLEKEIGARPYVLVYAFKGVGAMDEIVNAVKAYLGMVVISIGAFDVGCADFRHKNCSLSEWLWYHENAAFIITHSFHGTIFSIKNRKRFIAVQDSNHPNLRVNDLLDRYECKGRLVSAVDAAMNLISTEPDYAEIEMSVGRHVEETKQFLLRSLSKS